MWDRLRVVECPSEIIDQIGRWQNSSLGERYGLGYHLTAIQRWILAVF